MRGAPKPSALELYPLRQDILFGGEKGAQSVPPEAGPASIDVAKKLERYGLSAEDIFNQSGWYRGPDGKWKWTLSDKEASFNQDNVSIYAPYSPYSKPKNNEYVKFNFDGPRKLSEVFNHPNLFVTYPELKDITIERMPAGSTNIASYNVDKKVMRVKDGRPKNEVLSSILHELQHPIQGIEGFAEGGDPTDFAPKGKWGIRQPLTTETYDAAYKEYARLAGETEARQVQEQFKTQNWSQLPTQMEGFPTADQQLVRRGNSQVFTPGQTYKEASPPVPDYNPFSEDSAIGRAWDAIPTPWSVHNNIQDYVNPGRRTNLPSPDEYIPPAGVRNPYGGEQLGPQALGVYDRPRSQYQGDEVIRGRMPIPQAETPYAPQPSTNQNTRDYDTSRATGSAGGPLTNISWVPVENTPKWADEQESWVEVDHDPFPKLVPIQTTPQFTPSELEELANNRRTMNPAYGNMFYDEEETPYNPFKGSPQDYVQGNPTGYQWNPGMFSIYGRGIPTTGDEVIPTDYGDPTAYMREANENAKIRRWSTEGAFFSRNGPGHSADPIEPVTYEDIERESNIRRAIPTSPEFKPEELNLFWHGMGNQYRPDQRRTPGGQVETIRQAVVPGPGGKVYSIPTVWDAKQLTYDEAIQRAKQKGWSHWPSYDTPQQADIAYQGLHRYMDNYQGVR